MRRHAPPVIYSLAARPEDSKWAFTSATLSTKSLSTWAWRLTWKSNFRLAGTA